MPPKVQFEKQLPHNLFQAKEGQDLAIHEAAKLRDARYLHEIINLMLKADPEANLNPFVEVSPITGSGYDVLTLLERPLQLDVSKELKLPDSLAKSIEEEAPYCPKCEKILKTRICLQALEAQKDERLAPIFSKLSQEDYNFRNLDSKELNTLLNEAANSGIDIVRNFAAIYKNEIKSKIPPASIAITSPNSAIQLQSSNAFLQH